MGILEALISRYGGPFELEEWSGQCRLCRSDIDQISLGPEQLLQSGQGAYLCPNCGGLYMAPDFTPEALARFYGGAYRRLFVFEAGLKQDEAFYRRNLFAGYGELRAAKLQSLIPEGGSVFEMGSGCGSFLGALAKRRPDVQLYATELDYNIRHALLGSARVTFLDGTRNPDQLTGGLGGGPGLTLDELAEHGPFDLVVAFHTLEHLRDPLDFMKSARKVLKPGGQVLIEVPNGRMDWAAWYFLHPAHLSIFTVESLSRLAKRAGFEVLETGAHPWGDAFDGYLMMRGKCSIEADPPSAPPAEVAALKAHATRYHEAWGASHKARAFIKNMAVMALGPAIVGIWPRMRYRSLVGPRVRAMLADEAKSGANIQ